MCTPSSQVGRECAPMILTGMPAAEAVLGQPQAQLQRSALHACTLPTLTRACCTAIQPLTPRCCLPSDLPCSRLRVLPRLRRLHPTRHHLAGQPAPAG